MSENVTGFLQTFFKVVLIGALLAYLVHLGERFFGWPTSVRAFGGGGLFVVGSLLAGGGSGRILYQKGAVRGVDDRDIAEYKATRDANMSAGVGLLIIGGVVFVSLFVF